MILYRITSLVGCGADRALERRRNAHNSVRRSEIRITLRR